MTKRVFTQDNGILAIASEIVPDSEITGSPVITVEDEDLPHDVRFCKAWVISGDKIVVDLGKSKLVAHEMRREKRDAAFAPLDFIIAAQIPGDDLAETELQRVQIRDADAAKQIEIDDATTFEDVQAIVNGL